MQTFLDSNAQEFGRVTGTVAQKLLAGAPHIEFVDVGIRYQTVEVRRMIQQGLEPTVGANALV
ncbi:MAG: hypothetical protein P4L53_09130 [Candidatus Obscuribacterales bacterium]|nr:hypothetical protein [Candidatus Obscuribacterales bacterium]